MSLIKRRSEPAFIRTLRRKFLTDVKYTGIRRFFRDARMIYYFKIIQIPSGTNKKHEQSLAKLRAYYTPKFMQSAGLPKGQTILFSIYTPTLNYNRSSYAMYCQIGFDPDVLTSNYDSTKLVAPKILFNTDSNDSLLLSFEVMADIIEGLYNLAVEALNFGEPNSPNCLLIVDRLTSKVANSEVEIAKVAGELARECIGVFRALSTKTYVDTRSTRRKINRICLKLNKLADVTNRSNLLATTKGIHFKDATTASVGSIYDSGDEHANAMNLIYDGRERYVEQAISRDMIEKNNLILYTPEEVSGVFRGQTIYHLVRALNILAWQAKFTLGKYYGRGFPNSDTQYLAYGIARMLTILDALGVPNWKKQKVLNDAFAKYAPLVERDSNISELAGISPSLRKFVNKIAMPVDLSNTYDPVAEKQISNRLRVLAKFLSARYGVAYEPSAGEVALEAMKRAEAVDEIILDISAALEDCFGYINAAADPPQE